MIEFSIGHSEETVQAAYRAYWKYRYRGLLIGAKVVLTGLFVPVILYRGDVHWSLYCLITAVLLFILMLYSIRDSALKMALEQFRLIDPPAFRYRLSEVGVYEKSAICRCELQWHAFAGYLELPGFFALVRAPADGGQFIAFPTDQLPEDAARFFRERLQPLGAA